MEWVVEDTQVPSNGGPYEPPYVNVHFGDNGNQNIADDVAHSNSWTLNQLPGTAYLMGANIGGGNPGLNNYMAPGTQRSNTFFDLCYGHWSSNNLPTTC